MCVQIKLHQDEFSGEGRFRRFFFRQQPQNRKKISVGWKSVFLFLTKAAAHRLKGRPSTGRLKNKLIFFLGRRSSQKIFVTSCWRGATTLGRAAFDLKTVFYPTLMFELFGTHNTPFLAIYQLIN